MILKRIFSDTWKLFNLLQKKRIISVLILGIIASFFEIFGIAAIFPYFSIVLDSSLKNEYLIFCYNYLGYSSVDDFKIFLGICAIFFIVFSVLIRAYSNLQQLKICTLIESEVSSRLFEKFHRKSYSWFVKQHSSYLEKALITDVNNFATGILLPIIQLFINICLSIFAICLLVFVIPLSIMLILGLLLVFYFILNKITNTLVTSAANKRFDANQSRYHVLSESFGSYKVIKVSGLVTMFIDRFSKASNDYSSSYVKTQIIAQTPKYFLEAVLLGGGVLSTLVLMRNSNELNKLIPSLAILVFTGYRLIPSFQAIFHSISQLKFNNPSFESIIGFNSLVSDDSYISGVSITNINSITLEQVSYKYEESQIFIVENVSFNFIKGKSYGVIGQSGSGKSTLLDLILGLKSPNSGLIRVNSNILNSINERSYLSKVGYVSQEIALLDDTILMNIAMVNDLSEVNLDQIYRVSKLSQIHDFILNDLPNGYETRVGQKGVSLSGGQRQRIAIARALYKNPEVLILDEATSALDVKMEKLLLNSLFEIRDSMIVIMVAHRPDSINFVDTLINLDNGNK
jgi:ABC-type multidrug transport system fused ATPase/permease subunit